MVAYNPAFSVDECHDVGHTQIWHYPCPAPAPTAPFGAAAADDNDDDHHHMPAVSWGLAGEGSRREDGQSRFPSGRDNRDGNMLAMNQLGDCPQHENIRWQFTPLFPNETGLLRSAVPHTASGNLSWDMCLLPQSTTGQLTLAPCDSASSLSQVERWQVRGCLRICSTSCTMYVL